MGRIQPLSRRHFLRGSAACLPLPLLEAMEQRSPRGAGTKPIRRFVYLYMSFGMYAPTFYPDKEGSAYTASRMLKVSNAYRDDYTVMHGLCNTQVRGGHSAAPSILTGTNPLTMAGRNTISIDQEIAEHLGKDTRYESLIMQAGKAAISSVSWSRAMTQVPSEQVKDAFTKLFSNTDTRSPAERKRIYEENRSMLDDLRDQSKRLQKELAANDKRKLDEYLESIRGVEKKLEKEFKWSNKSKPQNPGYEFNEGEDSLAYFKTGLDVIRLAFMTDSTRVVNLLHGDTQNGVFPRIGSKDPWHALSHHSKDPVKLAQIGKIEEEQMRNYTHLFKILKETDENGRSLLDNSLVLIGDAMHDGNHHNVDLPVILAGHGGGKVNHGNYWKFPSEKTPLTNLYVSMAQQLGLEIDRFGPDSTGPLDKVELQA